MFELPDWKDASQYPSPGVSSNEHYAWEFLRRNAEYQSTWTKYIAALRSGSGGNALANQFIDYLAAPRLERERLRDRYALAREEFKAASEALSRLPCFCSTETIDERTRVARELAVTLAEPWGLEHLCSPAERFIWGGVRFANSKCLREVTSHGVRSLEEEFGDSTLGGSLVASKWLVLAIDLELPNEVTEGMVIRQIRSSRRFRKAKGLIAPLASRAVSPAQWTEYLRILDARASLVSFPCIGDALAPNESNAPPDYTRDKRLRAAHKRAEKLCATEYRSLPLLKATNID